jgi:hypothetical protein
VLSCDTKRVLSVTDFATEFATTGKVFEYASLYTCSDTPGALKILPHYPKTSAEKAVADTHPAVHVLTADDSPLIIYSQEIFKDARGFTYKSVRFCDLDRICNK